jgi:protein-L-isoaspartate(D-aspartate) O-methyltransferase
VDEYSKHADERERMVSSQIVRRGIRDERLLEAMRMIPRHLFTSREHRSLAYTDGPLPIGQGQTISQPYIVALMTELLNLKGDEIVLEVGTGSGYQAAVLAHLAMTVHSVERHAELAEHARSILQRLGYENVYVHVGDGSQGLPEYAPYQGIIVTAAAPRVPKPLMDQLDEGGRLVLPVGSLGGQILERWIRHGDDYKSESITPVAFVPLRGEHGWEKDYWGFS